jgi:hypothetical protein
MFVRKSYKYLCAKLEKWCLVGSSQGLNMVRDDMPVLKKIVQTSHKSPNAA